VRSSFFVVLNHVTRDVTKIDVYHTHTLSLTSNCGKKKTNNKRFKHVDDNDHDDYSIFYYKKKNRLFIFSSRNYVYTYLNIRRKDLLVRFFGSIVEKP